MKSPERLFVLFMCLLAFAAGKQEPRVDAAPLTGAWLQTDLRWEKAPATINPRLQNSQATILYFDADHTFAMLVCVVNRIPGEYTTISHGDGLALWRGQWIADRRGIAIWYKFVPARPRQWPEGPIVEQGIQHVTIHQTHDLLSFGDMKFKREPKLDDGARDAELTQSDVIETTPIR